MPRLADYAAWIEVGGERAEEYRSQPVGNNAVECHIQSKDGERFVVYWADRSAAENRDDLQTDLYLDGEMVAGHQMTIEDEERTFKESGWWKPGWGNEVHPFVFRRLVSSEYGSAAQAGVIKVVIQRGNLDRENPIYGDEDEENSDDESDEETDTNSNTAGKKEKGLRDDIATYDKTTKLSTEGDEGFASVTYPFESTKPDITFLFKYDSMRQLRAKGILPSYEVVQDENRALRARIAELEGRAER